MQPALSGARVAVRLFFIACVASCSAVSAISATVAGAFTLLFSDNGSYYYAQYDYRTKHDKKYFKNSHFIYAPFFLNKRPLLYKTTPVATSAITAAHMNAVHHQLPIVYIILATM